MLTIAVIFSHLFLVVASGALWHSDQKMYMKKKYRGSAVMLCAEKEKTVLLWQVVLEPKLCYFVKEVAANFNLHKTSSPNSLRYILLDRCQDILINFLRIPK